MIALHHWQGEAVAPLRVIARALPEANQKEKFSYIKI